jgi:monovalent cation:H+ antiporter-2, CPA2 family
VENAQLVLDLAMAVLSAFVGGTIAQRLGLPVLLGYLAGGLVIGPLTPGPSADLHSVQLLAEIGVAMLMFVLGAEFSVGELRGLGRVAAIGGPVQIIFIMLMGIPLAPLAGLSPIQGIYLGALLALSSTVVAMKLLMGRGELQSLHGRAALGILLIQDIAIVPMVVVLPSLAAGGGNVLADLATAGLKAAAVLLGAYLVGARVVPWALGHAAVPHSRELFILGVVGLALGTALVTSFAGLSLAFGAFLAGLVVAESEYRTQVIAEVIPLRDLFSSLFFVSLGMLIDPAALWSEAGLVVALVAVVLVGKVVIVALAGSLLGLPARVAFLAGLSLAQQGEFSFLLAGIGVDRGAIPQTVFTLVLGTVVLSILVSPFLLRAGPFLLSWLERAPLLRRWFQEPVEASSDAKDLRRHAVICGFGRVGRELADALERRGMHYLVIDYNPEVVKETRGRGVPVVFGDAGNPVVLDHAELGRAVVLAVLIPDARAAERATRYVRAKHPRLDIVARAADASQVVKLQDAGATEVVQPEFEAGVEVIRHAMRRYGIGGPELSALAAGRRSAFYRRATRET